MKAEEKTIQEKSNESATNWIELTQKEIKKLDSIMGSNEFRNDDEETLESLEQKITNNSTCLCCRSIICCNNWGPTITFKNILKEIYTNINYKKLYIYHICLKVIVRKYLFEDAESIILNYLNMITT